MSRLRTITETIEMAKSYSKKRSTNANNVNVPGPEPDSKYRLPDFKFISFRRIVRIVEQSDKEPWGKFFSDN